MKNFIAISVLLILFFLILAEYLHQIIFIQLTCLIMIILSSKIIYQLAIRKDYSFLSIDLGNFYRKIVIILMLFIGILSLIFFIYLIINHPNI